MIEGKIKKKFVSKNIAIILGIIYMILAIGLVGAIANYTSIINREDNIIALLNSQITDKDNTISSLNSQIESLQQQVNNLNQSYIDFQRKYEDLLFHDLNISLFLERSTYFRNDNEPVFGWVSITYLNGTAFRGAFTIYIRGITGNATTPWIQIDGLWTMFILSPPVWRFGPGTYTIGIDSLSTADGYVFQWQVFPSVQVEPQLS